MLARLARWLRAAGHDTALIDQGAGDARLIELCAREDRTLVTRDRRLADRAKAKVRTLLLSEDHLDDQARRIARALDLDWTHAPLTRCMIDNTPLEPAGAAELARMPGRTRLLPGPFRACPRCGRVFWPGSHAKRVLERLECWRAAR
jgi:uncharacterized protein with PIN domain